MAILELRGLKVLPPPDLDDGESLWIGPGAAQPRQCGGAGSGVLAGATDGVGRLLCRWSLALVNLEYKRYIFCSFHLCSPFSL